MFAYITLVILLSGFNFTNKEEELGYQRHFITVGNRMRRAAKELSNANQ